MTRSQEDDQARRASVGRAELLTAAVANALEAPANELLARVAAAIARPGPTSAFTIDAANAKDRDCEPAVAARSGRAFAVWARTDLFFVDIDFKAACERRPGTSADEVKERIAAYVMELVWSIEMAGSTALVCASGGEFSFHVFAAGLVPGAAQRLVERGSRERLVDLGHAHIPGKPAMAIRPPGSPHRSGTTYSKPLFVEDWDDVLRVLEAPPANSGTATPAGAAPGAFVTRPGRDARPNPLRRGAPRPLSKPYQVLLDTGDADAFVAAGGHLELGALFSRSEVLWRLLLAAVNAGYELEEFVALCEFGEKPGAEKIKKERRKRPPRRWADWLVGEWNKAVGFVEEHPSDRRSRASPEVMALIEAYSRYRWNGRGAGTRKAILRAMLCLVVARNTDRITGGARTMQLKAKIASTETVTKTEAELEAEGWLEKVGSRQRPDWAQRWRVKIPPIVRQEIDISSTGVSAGCETKCLVSLREDLHEVWCEDGLGHAAWLVWDDLLTRGPSTTAGLEARTGQDGAALRRHLRRFEEVGLVRRERKGKEALWSPQEEPDLDGIALRLGVAGFQQRLQARQAEERRRFSKLTNPVRRLIGTVRAPRPPGTARPANGGQGDRKARKTRRKRAD